MALVVQKYGGTSVGSLQHIASVAAHVAATSQRGDKVVVAISAMGEQTDELLTMAGELNPRPPRRELDMLVTAGERISAALLAIALDARKVAAVSLTGSQCGILTDDTHGNARVTRITGERIRQNLEGGRVVIVAGFQGVSPVTKEITTLGRGGTDLSAIALAAALEADVCQLYKDVLGVYTADPRLVPGARVKKRLSWQAMTELAWSGAAVLHPRGAHLAAKYNIPFEIRSSAQLDQTGTLIDGRHEVETPTIEALAHKKALSLVETQIQGAEGKGHAQGIIAKTLAWLWRHGDAPLLSTQTATTLGAVVLTQVIRSEFAEDYEAMIKAAAQEAGGKAERLRRIDGLGAVTVVGAGFQQSPETVDKVCAALSTVPVLLDTRNTTITVCVDESALAATLQGLHRSLIEAV